MKQKVKKQTKIRQSENTNNWRPFYTDKKKMSAMPRTTTTTKTIKPKFQSEREEEENQLWQTYIITDWKRRS